MMEILVAMPLVGRDAGLVPGWAAAVAAIAAAHPGVKFVTRAAVRGLDIAAKDACRAADIGIVEVPWYDIPPGRRKNKAGVTLKRIRLAREAILRGAVAIWYIDADVRPRPAHWAAIDALFRAHKTVVVLPYPPRWAPGHSPVVGIVNGDAQPELRDARCFRANEASSDVEASSAVIAGGGFGCTAIIAVVAGTTPFIVREAVNADGRLTGGEDVGWFLNAHRAGIEVRMPLGVVVEHIGCEPDVGPGRII